MRKACSLSGTTFAMDASLSSNFGTITSIFPSGWPCQASSLVGATSAISEGPRSFVLYFTDSPDVLRFVNSARAKALAWQGTSCPDHFVRTKVRPLFVDWDAAQGNADNQAIVAVNGRTGFIGSYPINKLTTDPLANARIGKARISADTGQ